MQVPYTKMHGTGNLILVVDQRQHNLMPPGADVIRRIGDERLGPGFDQMMWVGPADDANVTASYRVFNADGSEVEQCGNGVRCVARYLAGYSGTEKQMDLRSPAGIVAARVLPGGHVSVSMGTPRFSPADIPFLVATEADSYDLAVDDQIVKLSVVSMGNPHAVTRVDDVKAAPVEKLGPAIEHHEQFPERCNVGFMAVDDRASITLRVHERGVGETAACGTGACAAVASGQRLGLLDEQVTVQLPGGQVVVSWRGGDAVAWLTGNAELINEGTMDL